MRESGNSRRALMILVAELAIVLLIAAVPDFSSPSEYQGPPCYGEQLLGCLEQQTDLISMATECQGVGQHVCLAPLGKVSSALVEHVVAYFQEEYRIEIHVLPPVALPEGLVDDDREQIEAVTLAEYMGEVFPEESSDSQAVLIGLTPVDLYLNTEDWRSAFWATSDTINKGVVSSFRMNPETFGMDPDEGLLYTRVRKVVTRIIGTLYYRLPESADPRSVLYDNVLSVDDLDRMGEKLPTEARQ